jgi:hypothetical protein
VHRWFANDLTYAPSLIAVTASTNRSKADRSPAQWLPQRTGYRCQYAARWVAVKWRWRLTVDQAARNAIQSLFAGYTATSVLVPPPPRTSIGLVTAPPPPTTTVPAPSAVPPSPGDTKNCTDFTTWSAAQAWFALYFPHYGDVARLDAEGDGSPASPCQAALGHGRAPR